MKRIISTFLVLYLLWIALAGINGQELIVGAVMAFIIAYLIKDTSIYNFTANIIVQLVKFIVLYIPLFLWELIKSNVSLAKIVLNPKLPINPGFVTIKTGLDSDIGKLILANSITLTPGTLSVEVEGNELTIHWVDVKGETPNEYFREIAGGFEKRLGGIIQ